MSRGNYDWRGRHIEALVHPNPTRGIEAEIVKLIDALGDAIDGFESKQGFPTMPASESFGQIIEGVIDLLNYDLGALDGGSCWSQLAGYAKVVHWDLDMSQVVWEYDDEDEEE